MPPSKTRFITACQQMLALGVVLAALTPAASVVSLDVVRDAPGSAGYTSASGDLAAYTRASARKSVVPTQVIKPSVAEYALTAAPGATGAKTATPMLQARSKPGALPGSTEVTSLPQPVAGYGAVGVTWEHGVEVAEDRLSFQVRTRTGDTWTSWMELAYDADHAPDPDSGEGRHARPGTDALLVGDVDQVQVRALSTGALVPPDMKLAVIDPGQAARSAVEAPAIDTAESDAAPSAEDEVPLPDETNPEETDPDGLDLEAATYTPKPVIYSRAQWGADESMRDKSSLHYFEVHAGFVHHTVNANDYTRAEVPGIIRSIYAYHTQSKGWSDVGYNYLVDRFGRVWEGRYGGVDRPVVGAHTLGYNDYAFAMSAIGNFDIRKPSDAMVQAYGAVFAWKLSLHGVDASSPRQLVGSKSFPAVNGHRDAGQTACPGGYLYARLGEIRRLAAEAQRGWTGRELESDLASTPHPDLVVRRASDGRAFVIPTGGLTQFKRPVTVLAPWTAADTAVVSPDLTGDGHSDLVVVAADGSAQVHPGDGAGGLGDPVKQTDAFAGHDLVTAVGDLTGDGRNDLIARRTETGALDVFVGGGGGGFTRRLLDGVTDWSTFTKIAATGDVDSDGLADVLARDAGGRLWLYRGTGTSRLGERVQVPGRWSRFDTITGFGDFTSDGRADLFVRKPGQAGYVMPGRGNGTFAHRLGPIVRLKGPADVVGGDLTGNDAPDLLARSGAGLVVFPNAGTFETGPPIDTRLDLGSVTALLNAGDWNRDGTGDIITRSRKGNLHLRPGDGAGHFGSAVRIATGFGSVGLLAAVGDMTGDGWPDLMGQPAGGAIRIYPGNGVDGLKTSYLAHSRIDAGAQIPIGRWDGDGAPDSLFRKGDRLTLFTGNGPGGLTSPKALSLDLTRYDWVIGVSDVNLTGHPDLLVRAKRSGYLYLFRATTTGFAPRRFMGQGMNAYDLAG